VNIYHDYCERCFQLFPPDAGVTTCENCLKPEHGGKEMYIFRFCGEQRDQARKKRKASFVSVPVEEQIKDIFQRDGV